VVVIEHRMDLMMSVCNTIAVLDFGKLIAFGTPQQVQADPAVTDAYLGAERSGAERSGAKRSGAEPARAERPDGAAPHGEPSPHGPPQNEPPQNEPSAEERPHD